MYQWHDLYGLVFDGVVVQPGDCDNPNCCMYT